MKTSWIASVKNEHSISRVALQIGMKTKNGKNYGDCPACHASKRSTSGKGNRGPVNIFRADGGDYWKCFPCGAGGDTLDLVAYHLHGMKGSQVKDFKQIKEFFEVKNFATEEVEVQMKKEEYPPSHDIINLRERLRTSTVCKLQHEHIDEFLVRRGINPRRLLGCAIFPDSFDYDALTNVKLSSGDMMPFWPSSWAQRYPIMVPLFDLTLTMRSFQGRAINPREKPKSMCPAHYAQTGLFFANAQALEFLKSGGHKTVWVVEGEMDYMTMSCHHDGPVIGIKSGSIEIFSNIKHRKDVTFILATHNDKAGDRYAEKIVAQLLDNKVKRLILPEGDINDYAVRKKGSLDGLENFLHSVDFGDEMRAQAGLDILMETHKKIHKQDTRLQKTELVASMLSHVVALAHASIHFNVQATQELMGMRSIHGMATNVNLLQQKINAEIKKIKGAQSGVAADSGPHDDVVLMRKQVKENGIYIDGPVMAIERNVINILSQDPRVSDRLKYNELKDLTEYKGKPLGGSDVLDLMLFMQDNYGGFKLDHKNVGMCAAYISEQEENRYHPAKDMLMDLYENTNIEFAPANTDPEDLFLHYFRVDDEGSTKKKELYRAYAKYFLMSVVGRQVEDEYEVHSSAVIIGKQGDGKTRATQALAIRPEFFYNTPLNIWEKDAKLGCKGAVIYELAEGGGLDSPRVSDNMIKAFMSVPNYDYRKPYKATVERVPNSHVFIVTTNDEHIRFLSDPTGTRRFHAMFVGVGGDLRVEQLQQNMKYIYAKAMHMYYGTGPYREVGPAKGYYLPKELEKFGQKCNKRFAEVDPWISYVGAAIFNMWARWAIDMSNGMDQRKHLEFSIKDILEVLNLPKERQGKKEAKRAGQIVKELGCTEGSRRRVGTKRIPMWSIPDNYSDLASFDQEVWIQEQMNS